MGKGPESSSDTVTKISETTKVGSIGLTGADLIAALDVVAGSAAAQTRYSLDAVREITRPTAGSGYTPISGGSSSGVVRTIEMPSTSAPVSAPAVPMVLLAALVGVGAVLLVRGLK